MKIIVDTSIWSLALRRKKQAGQCAEVRKLVELISESRAQIIGPIRQEILSGIKSTTQFEALCRQLEAFPDLLLESSDYEKAASFYNACRSRGVQGSNTDFLICAVSHGRRMPIFTNDSDFERFQKIIHIKLYR